jgi:hypothetical protein
MYKKSIETLSVCLEEVLSFSTGFKHPAVLYEYFYECKYLYINTMAIRLQGFSEV